MSLTIHHVHVCAYVCTYVRVYVECSFASVDVTVTRHVADYTLCVCVCERVMCVMRAYACCKVAFSR